MPDAARGPRTRCSARGVLAGLPLGTWYPDDPLLRDALLVCATEVTTDEEIRRFGDALRDILADDARMPPRRPVRALRPQGPGHDAEPSGQAAQAAPDLGPRPPSGRRCSPPWPSCRVPAAAGARSRIRRPTPWRASRRSTAAPTPPALPELNEPEVVRHFVNLSQLNYAVDTGFYPLGSCTMKYNPKLNEWAARLPGFAALHPLAPDAVAQGTLELLWELEAVAGGDQRHGAP